MKWVGSVATLLVALWLGVVQTVGDQGSCSDDGEDPCPLLQPGIAGAGLPLYVGLQPQGDGWVYNLTFQHEKETHIRFILRHTDGGVQGEIDYGEYSEKSRTIRWPKDYFPLCGWRYFLIQEEDNRLYVLYENTTLERTDKLGYVLPDVKSNFMATKAKVHVNCHHRPLGSAPAMTTTPGEMDEHITPHDHTESTVNFRELPKASENITVDVDDDESTSTPAMDLENTFLFPVNNESTSALTRDEDNLFVFPPDDESFILTPQDNKSISKYPMAGEPGGGIGGVSTESDGSLTLPMPSPSSSEASHPQNHTRTPTEAYDELYVTPGSNGNTSMPPSNKGSSPEPTLITVKVDEKGKFEETNCSENCTVNPRQSVALPSESSHQQHYTTIPKTTKSPLEPRAATTDRAAYKGPGSSHVDPTGPSDMKKDNTVGIVVASVVIVCLCVCGGLCVLYWRRRGSTAITGNMNSREGASAPETIALRHE